MTFKKLDNSEAVFETEISAEELKQEFEKALKEAVKEAELPGFRKGKAPEQMVLSKIGEARILDEAALHLIEKAYPKLVEEARVRPISSPKVEILKIALGNPLLFRITVAILPDFELPDYKSIASLINKKETNKEDLDVSDKEVEDVIMEIRTANQSKEDREAKKEPPELSDEDAKKLGNFESVSLLKEKIKENIGKEKDIRAKDKKRAELIEDLVSKTKITVPEVLIQSELNRMFAQFSAEIERMGMKPEKYLENIKKTTEDLFKEWRVDAEKNAKLQLILDKISEVENLKPEEEKIKREVEHLTVHYKDADPVRIRTYVETVLTNDLVLSFLEGQK